MAVKRPVSITMLVGTLKTARDAVVMKRTKPVNAGDSEVVQWETNCDTILQMLLQ